MNEEIIEKFRGLLREEISELESKKNGLEKKVKKITDNFHVNDIQKLDKLSDEISSKNHTIIHLYSLIGSSLGKRLDI